MGREMWLVVSFFLLHFALMQNEAGQKEKANDLALERWAR